MGGGSKWKVGSVHLARPDLTQPCSQGTGPSPETEGLPCAGPLGQRGLLGVSEASQRGVKPGRRVQGCTGEGVGRALSRVPCAICRSLLVIHFKYSSAYMIFPKSLTIP